jgi:hypothetical protein
MTLSTSEILLAPHNPEGDWIEIAADDHGTYDMGLATIGAVKIFVRSGMVWDAKTTNNETRVRMWDVRGSNTGAGRGLKSYASEWFETYEEARQLYDILSVELASELIAPRHDMDIIDRLYELTGKVTLAKEGIV